MKFFRKHSYKRWFQEHKIKIGLLLITVVILYTGIVTNAKKENEEYYNLRVSQPVFVGTTTHTYTYVEGYRMPDVYIKDDSLFEDEKIVQQTGSEGSREVTVMVTYLNDEEAERKTLDTEITKEALPKIIRVGTKKRPEYITPVEGYTLTSRFGPRWGSQHRGIDMAVPTGTPVFATADGVVKESGRKGSYGKSIYIEHENGSASRYAHLSSMEVSVGDEVKQGDLIGYSGSTGNSTGPHLHFELWMGKEVVNPLKYLEK